jgi:hypothetical protein
MWSPLPNLHEKVFIVPPVENAKPARYASTAIAVDANRKKGMLTLPEKIFAEFDVNRG